MTKKVKVQLTTEVADIPKFCALNMHDAEELIDSAFHSTIEVRKGLETKSPEDVKVQLAKIEKIRTALGKADSNLADIFGILMGYVQLSEDKEQKVTENKNDIGEEK